MPWRRRGPHHDSGDDTVIVTVIGAGTMGRGIAQAFAQTGNEVILTDTYEKALEIAPSEIEKSISRLVKKGLIKEDPHVILGRIHTTMDLKKSRDSELFVEAVLEKLEVKSDLYKNLAEIARPEAIIASNTSSISINQLSSCVSFPERFIGMHFFNPVPVMKLVEIITCERTSNKTLETVLKITKDLGKDPVTSRDFPGFISNRILMPMIREAILSLEQGVANREDIDKTLKLGMNHPMGPLELADFIGLDVTYDIMQVLYHEFGDSRFMPPVTLRNMVNAKKLGRKTGEGFYKY